MNTNEIVIKLEKGSRQHDEWLCPKCGGVGTMMDGSLSITPHEVKLRPATKCSLCKGKGRVLAYPIPD